MTFEDLDELITPAPQKLGRPPLRQAPVETSQVVKRSDSWWNYVWWPEATKQVSEAVER